MKTPSEDHTDYGIKLKTRAKPNVTPPESGKMVLDPNDPEDSKLIELMLEQIYGKASQ